MTKLKTRAQTDEQAWALGNLDAWAEKAGIKLRYGGTVGKHPQTVLVDVKSQDTLFRVNRDGEIRDENPKGDDARKVTEFSDFVRAVRDAYPDMKLNDGSKDKDFAVHMVVHVSATDAEAAKREALRVAADEPDAVVFEDVQEE